jgi:hypothetical protein
VDALLRSLPGIVVVPYLLTCAFDRARQLDTLRQRPREFGAIALQLGDLEQSALGAMLKRHHGIAPLLVMMLDFLLMLLAPVSQYCQTAGDVGGLLPKRFLLVLAPMQYCSSFG